MQLFEPILPGHRYLSHQHAIQQGFAIPQPISVRQCQCTLPFPGELSRWRREDGDTWRSEALIAWAGAALPSGARCELRGGFPSARRAGTDRGLASVPAGTAPGGGRPRTAKGRLRADLTAVSQYRSADKRAGRGLIARAYSDSTRGMHSNWKRVDLDLDFIC